MAEFRYHCDVCGRFMPWKPEPGSSWVWVPDSDVSYEEDSRRCVNCTRKHGPRVPMQNVVVEMCSGVYPAAAEQQGAMGR